MPMVSARHSFVGVKTLLHDHPFPIGSQNKAVKINLKTIADGIIVNTGGKTARANQCFAIESTTISDPAQFRWCISSESTATAANVDSQFVRTGRQAPFEPGPNRSGDARGMPVHAHNAAQRLKPKRIT